MRIGPLSPARAGLVVYAVCATLTGGVAAQGRSLAAEHRQRLTELQPKIDSAVEKAIRYILNQQQRDGNWAYHAHLFPGGQTGLSVYALLKAGLPIEHAAIQRGLAAIRASNPRYVYSTAAQILALVEAGLPEDRVAIEERAELLMSWQQRGSWGYPNGDGSLPGHHNAVDLSVAQFGLLGLRAAAKAGVDVERRRWLSALEATFDYQGKPRRREGEEIAGFTYRINDGRESGSMVTAGITSLMVSREGLDKLSRTQAHLIDEGVELALNWLRMHFAVDKNPAVGGGNLHYYLYGLERVGGLLGIEYIGDHPWYLEGAEFLVKKQADAGNWHSRHGEPDSCFGILFLKRATMPITGQKARQRPVTTAEEKDHELAVRAVGGPDGSPIDLWITRVGLHNDKGKPLVKWHVEKVEYSLDGAVIATVEGNPEHPWQAEPLHTRHVPVRRGLHKFTVRAHVLVPDGDDVRREVLVNDALEVTPRDVLEPWMMPAATAPQKDQLTPDMLGVVRASSQHDKHGGSRVADGLADTAWLCAADDQKPSLRLDLRRAVRASTIVIAPACSRLGQEGEFDRVARYSVRVNKKKAIEVQAPEAERAGVRIDLGHASVIRRLEITLLERSEGRKKGVAGIGEVLLLR